MPPAYAYRLPVQIVQYFRDFERTAELVKKQYLFAVVIVYPAELVIRRSVHIVVAVFLEYITCLSAPRRAIYVIDFHIAKRPLELIFQFLNERGIKTSQGGLWNKSSFHRIFSNRRYLGKCIYHGEEIDGGMPQLIDDELFAEAQKVLAKYAAAPSRGKAKVEYLLSDKMICGHCGNKMTGISSTSRNKKIYHYYKCAGNNKGVCKKRTIRKQFIEDEVISAIVGEHGILTDEFIDTIAAETYLLIQSEQNDTEIKRLENLVAENQKAINNLMQALMLGKIADTILSQIEKLENENKELQDTIANEKAMQINYSYADIRKWLSHFRTLDYSKTKNRKDLIDTFIYRVILYDDKMKVLFHLKGGQQGELLLNLIFPDYPDGHGDDGENAQKMPENEKETDKAVSNSDINAECAYTSRLVEITGLAFQRAHTESSCFLYSLICASVQRGKTQSVFPRAGPSLSPP